MDKLLSLRYLTTLYQLQDYVASKEIIGRSRVYHSTSKGIREEGVVAHFKTLPWYVLSD